jgi:DNA-binding NarL/FixJ family response regulator
MGLVALAAAMWIAGRPEEAIERADEAIVLSRAMGLAFPALAATDVKGIAQVFSGDVDAGVQSGHATIALSEEAGERSVRGYALHSLAIAALRQDRLDDAEALGRQGVETRLLLGDVAGLAHIVEVLAFIASARGDHLRATTLLGGADAIWRSVSGQEYAPLVADQQAAQAAASASLGPSRYRTALETGQQLDPSAVARFAVDGQLPDRPRALPRPSLPGLSARELEVARLVTEGATNAETASRLFISERTVESHVTNIFNKLGVSTRAQVAQWVTKLDAASSAA